MILDTLTNAGLYLDVHPLFPEAFTWLVSLDADAPPGGTHELRGRDLYVIISHTPGQPPAPPKLEAHRRYIDLQVTLRGTFDIGWRSLDRCRVVKTPYDSEKDAALFDDPPESWLTLGQGRFAVFFPGDAHAPKASPQELVKAVFKVLV